MREIAYLVQPRSRIVRDGVKDDFFDLDVGKNYCAATICPKSESCSIFCPPISGYWITRIGLYTARCSVENTRYNAIIVNI